jgi:ATP-binding cassette subfamily B protein
MGPKLKLLYIIPALLFIAQAILIFRPYVSKLFLDNLLTKDIALVYSALGLFLLVHVSGNLLRGFAGIKMNRTIRSTLYKTRTVLMEYCYKHPQKFFAESFAGKLTSRIMKAQYACIWAFSSYENYSTLVSVLGALILIYSVSKHLAAILLGFGLLMVFIYRVGMRIVYKKAMIFEKAKSLVTGLIIDFISNINAIRLSGTQKLEESAQDKYLLDHALKATDEYLSRTKLDIIIVFLMAAMQAYAVLYLVGQHQLGLVTVGEISMVILLILQFKHASLDFIKEQMRLALEKAEIQDALDGILQPLEQQDPASPLVFPKQKTAAIQFNSLNLCFDKLHAINNLSLKIPAGQKIGIVGHSGAGKSTLIKTLLHTHPVAKASVFMNSIDIRDIRRSDLLANIAVVDQETLLFNRSILENITLGKKVSDKQLKTAIKQAHLTQFIKSLDQGLNTMVGERGVKLSGGQKQRIGIARALLKNAPIIILDEATSALDSKSEKHIQAALQTLTKDKTVIAIAHRLSTLNIMDRIIVMQDGKIIQDGTHQQLLESKGVYQKLWQHQSNGFISK